MFHYLIVNKYFITTDRVKLFNRPETLDFFNPPAGGYLRKGG